MKNLIIPILLITLIGVFSTCKKKDEGPLLTARTGPDTTASIGDTVYLDASASSGSGYEVTWVFHNQPGDDTIAYANSDSAYFIPTENGAYQIELTISQGDLFNTDYMDVLVSGAVALEDINTSTRLKKIAVSDEPDYVATGDWKVSAELIIELGVIIEFTTNASMVVENGGEVYAANASFIAADSTWKGIYLKTEENSFENCFIENAGNASLTGDPEEIASVVLESGATVAFSGNTIKYSGGVGIYVRNGASFFNDTENQVYPYRNNHFIRNSGGPMVIPVHVLSNLSGQYFDEEIEGSFIEIYASTYSSTISKAPWLSDQGVPYLITGPVQFDKDFTINNGVEVYFEEDAELRVNGKLTISGTPEDPVLLDGVNDGSWKGIYVKGGQVDLTSCSILDAGNAPVTGLSEKAAITLEQLLSMRNSTISGSGGIGLNMPGNAHIQYSENFTGNNFANNTTTAVRIRMDDVNKVVSGSTISTASGVPAIEVHMGIDDPLGTWVNLDADYDYRILEPLTIKETKDLVIEAGTVIKMPLGGTLTVNGGLTARGSSGSMISIVGQVAEKGHWDGIILNGSQKVDLDFITISDGGGGFLEKGNLIVRQAAADVSVSNSTINNSKGYGVLVKSGASDFGINDPASNNTLEGDLGGFHKESK